MQYCIVIWCNLVVSWILIPDMGVIVENQRTRWGTATEEEDEQFFLETLEYPGLARDSYWFNSGNENRAAYQRVLAEARSEEPGMQAPSGVTQEIHLSEEHVSDLQADEANAASMPLEEDGESEEESDGEPSDFADSVPTSDFARIPCRLAAWI